jgi:hypothetical protein
MPINRRFCRHSFPQERVGEAFGHTAKLVVGMKWNHIALRGKMALIGVAHATCDGESRNETTHFRRLVNRG